MNKERITQTLEKTNFWQKVFPHHSPVTQGSDAIDQNQPDAVQRPSPDTQKKGVPSVSSGSGGQPPESGSQTTTTSEPVSSKAGPSTTEKTVPPSEGVKQKGSSVPADNPSAGKLPSTGTADAIPGKQSPTVPVDKTPSVAVGSPKGIPQSVPPEKPATKIRRIYLVRVEEDGTVTRVPVERGLPSSDTPLGDVITSLLKGPNPSEKQKGYTSLIPVGTRLYSAVVKDGIAYLNFSEDFLFNPYGTEGYLGQLKQIVWTATEFSTVKQVQILIEGKITEYVGEGIRIGKPLSRDSF